jgi:hypothetical protein
MKEWDEELKMTVEGVEPGILNGVLPSKVSL